MLEKDIQLHILKYLQGIGANCGKTKTMGVKRGRVFCYDPYVFRGFPDISGFYNKKLFFIEVKRYPNKQSYEQQRFQQLCNEAGITYILAYSVEDVTKLLH